MLKKYYTYLPDLRESLILMAFLIVAGTVLGGMAGLIIKFTIPSFSSSAAGLITYPLIFLPPYLWMIRPVKREEIVGEPIPFNKPDFGRLGTFLGFVLILPLVFAVNIVTEPLTMWMKTPEFMKELMNQVSENRIISLLTLVVFAPLLEELFCRGIILRGLLKHTSPLKAIVWSAAIFGIMHMNPWQAIPAFITGLLMGWIYWKTRSLWATIFIHFVNNGFAYIVTIFFPQLPDDAHFYDMIPGVYYYITCFLAIVYAVTVLLIMNKIHDKSLSR